ncbi:hypothetical protein [Bacillus cereus group sp. BfR-BA-01349]|uniref:hypothetical protein n=1 Tax=Bacillus cereus group sp. BfR-BA-01349 TaxID=2920312 RepID=UPI001F56F131
MKFAKKIVLTFGLSSTILFTTVVSEASAAYDYNSGGKTYSCSTVKTMSVSQVQEAARQVQKASNYTNGATLIAGWFNKYVGTGMGVFALGLGTSASKWGNAAAAGKKARQDHCVMKKPSYNGYNGPYSIARYLFY